jgi:hypothetical protein
MMMMPAALHEQFMTITKMLSFMIIVIVIFLTSTIAVESQQKKYTSDLLFIALFSDGISQIVNDINIIDIEKVQTRIPLFGKNVSGINVIDRQLGSPVEFIEENRESKEVLINSYNEQGIRITYQTSDLAHNMNKKWVFSLNSSIPFTLKLPINSTIIDWNDKPTLLELLGEQHLLSFNPGNITVSYIIENT